MTKQQGILLAWRKNKVLEQAEAAALLGVPLKTYRNWEQGLPMSAAAFSLIFAVTVLQNIGMKAVEEYKTMRNVSREDVTNG